MKVEFAIFARQYAKYQKEYEKAALRALRSGWYILGKELESFESEYAAFQGAKHCAGVGNGLDALRLSLLALGVGSGDEVIVQANTFIATALAITEVGAKPVYVDMDEFFGIDPDAIEAAVTTRTRAVMAVHLYGQPCEMDRICAITRERGLSLIEDCAQAHGARYKGRMVGSFGDLSCFSFYPMKPVGAFGDAGCVVTNSNRLDERVRMLRNYGARVKYHHELAGINSRMDELQAAILKVSLKYVEAGNQERRAIANKYRAGIKNPKVRLPEERSGVEHAYHVFALRCQERDALQNHLLKHDIHPQIHYPIPCHMADCYRDLGYGPGDFPRTERCAIEELSLPIYVGMPEDEIRYVIDAINAF